MSINAKKVVSRETCKSIRSQEEPHLPCLLKVSNGSSFCAIHAQLLENIYFNKEIGCSIETEERPVTRTINSIIQNAIIEPAVPTKASVIGQVRCPSPQKSDILHEQKQSTVEMSYKENEDDLEIKLLILVNECKDQIAELIGPVFNDVCVSEDQSDPITFDPFWEYQDGKKLPMYHNTYYLFSYHDTKNKVRCLTVFTIYNMFKDNTFIHPITQEPISDEAVTRAKTLVDLYSTQINLFKSQNSNMSEEYLLKNRVTKLFQQFHIHNIYLDVAWFTSINDKNNLNKIIKETSNLIKNNAKLINPKKDKIDAFLCKEPNEVTELQNYIVNEWQKLLNAADIPQNQIPIWIIVSGLSFVVPEIKVKFPDLEILT